MLEVRDLTVETGGHTVLQGVDIGVANGETVALFGANGSGKTSLLHTIMGIPGYRILSGRILVKDQDISRKTVDERARMGIGLAYQRPPALRGVGLADLLAAIRGPERGGNRAALDECFRRLALKGFEARDVNLGFSGGEIKRSELLQLLVQEPDLVLLDEPDSGVDLVSIGVIGEVINHMLEKDRPQAARRRGGLIITHTGHILDHVNADRACVMAGGRILRSGNPRDLLEDIRRRGYEGCVRCPL